MSKLRLRKCVGVLTVLATLLLASPVLAGVGTAGISIDNCGADPGTTVTVPINITDASGVAGATIELHYQPSVVIVDDYTAGDMGGSLTLGAIDNDAGVARMVWFLGTPVTGDHVYANVVLHAVGSGGATSPLDLVVVDYGNSIGLPIENTATDGEFTVTAPAAELVADAGGPYSGTAGSPVNLSGSATGGKSPYKYAWDLDGDSIYETSGKDVNHTWTESGVYTVGLKVTDNVKPASKAATDTDTADVYISAAAPSQYALTMAVVGEGTATDVTNVSPYEEGAEVSIAAVAAEGYQFVNWTAPAGTFLAADAEATTFTMPGEAVTVTANFEFELIPATYALTMAVVGEGTATDVTNVSPYEEGAEVSIAAVAAEGYQFVNWTAPAGTFLAADAEATTFTMPGEVVTVTANFGEISAETTPVTGNVVEAGYIDVTAPSAIDLGDMLRGETYEDQSDKPGSVDTNYKTWSVEARDVKGGENAGHMVSGSTPLLNTLQIGKSEGFYNDAHMGIFYVDVKTLPFYVSQTVDSNDVIGSYSITITFTALP